MSNELILSDATKLAELIRNKEVSPVEVVQAHLERIQEVNPQVNAIVTVADGALEPPEEPKPQSVLVRNWAHFTGCRLPSRIRSTQPAY